MNRVLVVDDNEQNLYYLESLLSSNDWLVDLAKHGEEALIKASQNLPDLVISDLLMPNMDGYTLLKRWKVDLTLKRVPFIVYTATYTEPEDEQLARKLGADAFILKPCDPVVFLSHVREVRENLVGSMPREPQTPASDEVNQLQEYSETLIRKLEEKSLQLEAANHILHADIAKRMEIEAALRDSEAKFRGLTDSMPQMVWIAQPDGLNTFCNRRWSEYTGLSSADSKESKWDKTVHSEDQPLMQAAWQEAIRSGESFECEARLRRFDGTYRWWLIRSEPQLDETGNVIKWFGTCTDIDQLREAQQSLSNAEDQLRQSQKMEAIGVLAGGVAHDFNNLLSVILGNIDIILNSLEPSEPIKARLGMMSKAGKRAATMTQQLLAFSRKQVYQPMVINLGSVVQNMEPILNHLIGEDIKTSLVLPREGSGSVFLDPTQVEQIVMNLVVNARDAMPRGGSLSIEVYNFDQDETSALKHPGLAVGAYVLLSVRDTGVGIDKGDVSRIFDPFFTTKDPSQGTGLGLSTVFGIVKQANGYIEVKSELGLSTDFRVFIPRTDRPADLRVPEKNANLESGGNETILLVEDDEDVRKVACEILERHGYKVLDAQNGGEAFLICEKFTEDIHLLVTDVVMPRMSGRELVERLSPMRPKMKLLYMSGYTGNVTIRHGILDMDIPFLQKPITSDILLSKVRQAIEFNRNGFVSIPG